MTLTVTEKEHWKRRIESKIDRRIKTLIANTTPTYLEDVKARARRQALKELGLERLYDLKVKLKEAEKKAQRELLDVNRKLAATVSGKTEDELVGRQEYQLLAMTDQAVTDTASVLEHRLMRGDDLGRQVLRLRGEREELLDTVWLATSPRQIRELWQDVSQLLGEEPTELQKSALATGAAAEVDH